MYLLLVGPQSLYDACSSPSNSQTLSTYSPQTPSVWQLLSRCPPARPGLTTAACTDPQYFSLSHQPEDASYRCPAERRGQMEGVFGMRASYFLLLLLWNLQISCLLF